MKIETYALIFVGLIWLSACSNDKSSEASTTTKEDVVQSGVAPGAIDNYIKLKNSLVASNASAAQQNALELVQSLKDEQREISVIEAAAVISSSTELEGQRKSFEVLSNLLITSLKKHGSGQKVFVQYCPMAFDNDGASWISVTKEIENPYFGDAMLHCGSVEEVIE